MERILWYTSAASVMSIALCAAGAYYRSWRRGRWLFGGAILLAFSPLFDPMFIWSKAFLDPLAWMYASLAILALWLTYRGEQFGRVVVALVLGFLSFLTLVEAWGYSWFRFSVDERIAFLIGLVRLGLAYTTLRSQAIGRYLAHRKWRRRPRRNHCPACGYNLRALTASRCPECGCPKKTEGGMQSARLGT